VRIHGNQLNSSRTKGAQFLTSKQAHMRPMTHGSSIQSTPKPKLIGCHHKTFHPWVPPRESEQFWVKKGIFKGALLSFRRSTN